MSGREAGSSGWPAGGGLTPRVGGEEARPPSRNPRLQGGAIGGGEAPASRQGQTPRVPSAKGGKQGQRAREETWETVAGPGRSSLQPPSGVPELGKSPRYPRGAGHSGQVSPRSRRSDHRHCRPHHRRPSREAQLAYRPLGKGPATLRGRPALPQISRGGWAEESIAGRCWAQVFEGWEGFF